MAEQALQFSVTNGDIGVVFSCPNHGKRIWETVRNLRIDRANPQGEEQLTARFVSADPNVTFYFDGMRCTGETRHEAVFFENTDYPLFARVAKNCNKPVKNLKLALSAHRVEDSELKNSISNVGGMLIGMLNFKNQVGLVDFEFSYTIDGKEKKMAFTTEVLSYKMNYRTDMKAIIADIEREYSMLSYSFLKQTYLSFRTKQGQSTELIWWQIFQSCYDEIIKATETIINSPKRRLKTAVRHERAERLPYISPELENEYNEFKNHPNHLYRTEELFLSKDTIENRFLKHVVKEIYRRFGTIRLHIKNSLNVADEKISVRLDEMENRLLRLTNHRFFKGIGMFKGFAQDSMVMKQARGYKDIYRCWIELQCGFELENGVRRLEVKDISDLYEIWCFIKVKNMVSEILGESATAQSSGKELTSGFIRQLVYGQQSEVTFFNRDNVELASVMYNAEVEKEDEAEIESAIKGTDTLTTIQRPDIVLRLSKIGDTIQYTYLFDAKYRIADKSIYGLDVPPVDAINQMHRYRDAIYYTENSNEQLKREVIGGYVLYPGNLTRDEFGKSYYKRSIDRIGIGAFPLKPAPLLVDEDGNAYLDPMSSENELRQQIEQWLKDDNARQTLLQQAIPQRGLEYREEGRGDVVLVNYANEEHWDLFVEKKLCYLRTGDTAGSVRMPAMGREPRYVLLHDGNNRHELFRLSQEGGRIYSKEELVKKGFAPQHDGFYLCYKISSTKPVEVEGIDYGSLIRRGKATNAPHFEMVEGIKELRH